MPSERSVEPAYVDPIALRSLYLHDTRSAPMVAWRRRNSAALPLTRHGHVELVNSFALAVFRGFIDVTRLGSLVAAVDQDLDVGRLYVADVAWRRALDRAARLSRDHTPELGTRTRDVLHVACALELGCKAFVTYDARQADLARTVRLRVSSPG